MYTLLLYHLFIYIMFVWRWAVSEILFIVTVLSHMLRRIFFLPNLLFLLFFAGKFPHFFQACMSSMENASGFVSSLFLFCLSVLSLFLPLFYLHYIIYSAISSLEQLLLGLWLLSQMWDFHLLFQEKNPVSWFHCTGCDYCWTSWSSWRSYCTMLTRVVLWPCQVLTR